MSAWEISGDVIVTVTVSPAFTFVTGFPSLVTDKENDPAALAGIISEVNSAKTNTNEAKRFFFITSSYSS